MPIEEYLSKINFGGFSSALTYFIFAIIIMVILGVIAFFLIRILRFKYKVIIFENLSGRGYVPVLKDKAELVRIGQGGAEILWLAKKRQFVQAYGTKMGKNTYWFAVGNDGYLRNFILTDLNKDLKDMGVLIIDRDMRYMHVAIQRNVKDRYNELGFFGKYGGVIAYISLIVVTIVMMYLLFDKWLEVSGALTSAIDSAQKVVEASAKLLGAVDQFNSNGGLTPANA